jgi:amino-acid N-acetyltransferase
MTLQIREGTARDFERIRALLTADSLPTDDLEVAAPHFVVASAAGGHVVGAGALQWFGDAALLRSITVAAEFRNSGFGRHL